MSKHRLDAEHGPILYASVKKGNYYPEKQTLNLFIKQKIWPGFSLVSYFDFLLYTPSYYTDLVLQIHVSFSPTYIFPSDLLMANLFSTSVVNF